MTSRAVRPGKPEGGLPRGRGQRRFAAVARAWAWLCLAPLGFAQPFYFPTANRALLEQGGGERFFVGTAGKSWMTGAFGCVRSEGRQMHEGLDIRCLQRDARGEPTDPILAAADGTVAYCNSKPGLSNYGNYVVLRHEVEGLEIYSLYAHLSEIRSELKPGLRLRAGEKIGVMGHTANTHERISKERAHVHFELNLLANDRFARWHQVKCPGQRNDHGEWNGQNLLGFDPAQVFREQAAQGAAFSLLRLLRSQTELCRVVVRGVGFPWVKRYPALVLRNPKAEQEGTAGYELRLNYNGIPFQLIPRAASELHDEGKVRLLSVNEPEQALHPSRHLVVKRSGGWELSHQGQQLLDLLTY